MLVVVSATATLPDESGESSLSRGKVCACYCASERRRHSQDLAAAARDIELTKRMGPEGDCVGEMGDPFVEEEVGNVRAK